METNSFSFEDEEDRLFVGPYELLEVLGEGGMGTVWMARQEQPVRRRVALKLIKPDLSSDQIVARFEAERQALALMEHQHIAKVLDAGSTDEGRPYFVMELVRGVPFNTFCDNHRLALESRLTLFVQVCKAIQHAHQKGILHRDLKPTNVLVTMHDGDAVPKVIDFGLAKALQHQTKLTDKSIATEFNRIVGTIQYMSPEQAQMRPTDVDTRSDIYSLGAMLYELLTGTTPIEEEALREHTFLEILDWIRNKEPPRPSVRFNDLGDGASAVAEKRVIEPRKLRQQLRGDLDWICLKAMEKEPGRRYASATELAADITRYLQQTPVHARPPSTMYQVEKLVARNRSIFLVGGTVLILGIVVGLVMHAPFAVGLLMLITAVIFGGVIWRMYIRQDELRRGAEHQKEQALRAERLAQEHAIEARQEKEAAESARRQAERETRRMRAVEEFLRTMLVGGDPWKGKGLSTIPEMLDWGVEQLQHATLDGDVEAPVRRTIGRTYFHLRVFDKALEQLRAAHRVMESTLGGDDREVLRILTEIGEVYLFSGDHANAEVVLHDALEKTERSFGEQDLDVAWCMDRLGICLNNLGRSGEAESLHTRALDACRSVDSSDPYRESVYRANLAESLIALHRYAEAEPLLRASLSTALAMKGEDHPSVGFALLNLGIVLTEIGDRESFQEAESLILKSQRLLGARLPHDSAARQRIRQALVNLYAPQRMNDPSKLAEVEAS